MRFQVWYAGEYYNHNTCMHIILSVALVVLRIKFRNIIAAFMNRFNYKY